MINIPHKPIKGVYCIKNKVNNKIYIGSSVNIYYRLARHISGLKLKNHHNEHLTNAVHKYGIDNFECFVVKECEDYVE